MALIINHRQRSVSAELDLMVFEKLNELGAPKFIRKISGCKYNVKLQQKVEE